MKKNNLPYVVVIDIDHINGLQTARLFAERKVPVIGIANNLKNYPAKLVTLLFFTAAGLSNSIPKR